MSKVANTFRRLSVLIETPDNHTQKQKKNKYHLR